MKFNKFIYTTFYTVARATKYALAIVSILALYKCMLSFSWGLLKYCWVNWCFILVIGSIQLKFKELMINCNSNNNNAS